MEKSELLAEKRSWACPESRTILSSQHSLFDQRMKNRPPEGVDRTWERSSLVPGQGARRISLEHGRIISRRPIFYDPVTESYKAGARSTAHKVYALLPSQSGVLVPRPGLSSRKGVFILWSRRPVRGVSSSKKGGGRGAREEDPCWIQPSEANRREVCSTHAVSSEAEGFSVLGETERLAGSR